MKTIPERIAYILADQSCHPQDSITPETIIESGLGMDSLDIIQAVMLIEDEFDIVIEDAEIEPCKTVGEIIDLVTTKGGV